MSSILVLEVTDDRWSEFIEKSNKYDFYHTQSYHLLEKENRPVLLVVDFEKHFIALPLIIRQIPNTDCYDCTSSYGYSGPISSVGFDKISDLDLLHFQKELDLFFVKNMIISVFCRLHPLLLNDTVFDNYGVVKSINQTVVIDIRLTPVEQTRQYRKSCKSELNQLRKKEYNVVEAKTLKQVKIFSDIYHETMRRISAPENYYFDSKYFNFFVNNKHFTTKILLVKLGDEYCAGAIFTISKGIMQYHLAGTSEKYITDAPMKLILDEARSIACTLNLECLHLGGGVNGSDTDSLFRFKAGFSHYRCMYKVWQKIVDLKRYEELVAEKGVNTNSNFFPLYRSLPIKKIKTYLYGASGHAKVVIDSLNLNNQKVIAIIDDNPKSHYLLNIPIFNSKELDFEANKVEMIITVGENHIRKMLSKKWKGVFKKVSHPSAIISNFASVGDGTVIMANATINANASVGKHVIINTGAIIEHDCIVEDYVHVSPNAALAGSVYVGEGTQVGIGACIRQGIKIGKWATIGAGSVVVKDIPDYAVVIGNPARILKYNTIVEN